jgi:outer membrane protein OmpA-like peptidoglycan-associated protein
MTCQYIAPTATGNTIKPYIARTVEIVTLPSLRCIFFDYDKSFLRPDAKFELNRLARYLRQNPSYIVEVDGHTDAHGSKEYNRELSDDRATSAIEYLKQQGIPATNIIEKTYGESDPIAINEYPDGQDAALGRQYNRRVEFTIRDAQNDVLGVVNEIRVPESLQKD